MIDGPYTWELISHINGWRTLHERLDISGKALGFGRWALLVGQLVFGCQRKANAEQTQSQRKSNAKPMQRRCEANASQCEANAQAIESQGSPAKDPRGDGGDSSAIIGEPDPRPKAYNTLHPAFWFQAGLWILRSTLRWWRHQAGRNLARLFFVHFRPSFRMRLLPKSKNFWLIHARIGMTSHGMCQILCIGRSLSIWQLFLATPPMKMCRMDAKPLDQHPSSLLFVPTSKIYHLAPALSVDYGFDEPPFVDASVAPIDIPDLDDFVF